MDEMKAKLEAMTMAQLWQVLKMARSNAGGELFDYGRDSRTNRKAACVAYMLETYPASFLHGAMSPQPFSRQQVLERSLAEAERRMKRADDEHRLACDAYHEASRALDAFHMNTPY
jgi:hypothetical protein